MNDYNLATLLAMQLHLHSVRCLRGKMLAGAMALTLAVMQCSCGSDRCAGTEQAVKAYLAAQGVLSAQGATPHLGPALARHPALPAAS